MSTHIHVLYCYLCVWGGGGGIRWYVTNKVYMTSTVCLPDATEFFTKKYIRYVDPIPNAYVNALYGIQVITFKLHRFMVLLFESLLALS